MKFLRRLGLPERLLAILLLFLVVDFAVNTVIFQRANSFELRQDDASRIAENLVLASRAVERAQVRDRVIVSHALSSSRFLIKWSPAPAKASEHLGLAKLRMQVVEFAPELARTRLDMHVQSLPGGNNIGGSIVLSDASVLTFETYARSAWKLSVGRLVAMVLPTLLLATLAWTLLNQALKPLKLLIKATRQVGSEFGSGPPEPVPEQGPQEMRDLIHAVNQMQQRVHRSFVDRTQTMLAIGHDLRTPLARMQLRLEAHTLDRRTTDELADDIAEMQHLIESLQAFVESGGTDSVPPVRVDLAAMAATLVDTAADLGGNAAYDGPDHLEILARPVAIRRAISNLIENALHYGGNARVVLRRHGPAVVLAVEDGGPGIPEDRFDDVVQPFVRLDSARGRDTPGMGLGLAIVKRAMEQEGGTLELANRAGGGLTATIRLSAATA